MYPTFYKAKIPWVFLFATVTFLISEIPYLSATAFAPPHYKFLGQVSCTVDQNMYYSFVRQAYDGKELFNNRLTYEPNGGAFFNVQFWSVGFLMKTLRLSENGVYLLWRLIATIVLVAGFAFLSSLMISSMERWLLAQLLFCLGGGFGIIPVFAFKAGLISKELMYTLSYDIWGGLHPFQQIVTNPHFSLPHGLMLFGFALVLLAERNKSILHYIAAGVVFAINGFIRPYDLTAVFAICPIFIIVESLIGGFNYRTAFMRILPVILILPSLGYNIWLFKFNEFFKYWSMQGHNVGSLPAIWWHLIAFGPVMFLALPRILKVKSQPLSREERFLCVWFLTVFGMIYIGLLIPSLGFSPQIGVTLMSPLVILGFMIKDKRILFFDLESRIHRRLLVGTLFLVVLLGNAGVTVYYSMKFPLHASTGTFYAEDNIVDAWRWVNDNLGKEEVILAKPGSSNRLAKYTSEQTLAGHYSVTPHYADNEKAVNLFFSDSSTVTEREQFIKEKNIKYLWIGPEERAGCKADFDTVVWSKRVFRNDSVSIYRVVD